MVEVAYCDFCDRSDCLDVAECECCSRDVHYSTSFCERCAGTLDKNLINNFNTLSNPTICKECVNILEIYPVIKGIDTQTANEINNVKITKILERKILLRSIYKTRLDNLKNLPSELIKFAKPFTEENITKEDKSNEQI